MFLEKVYRGRNQWYFYILSLIIVFIATQVGTLPLLGYIRCKFPEALRTGDISAATSTHAGLALALFSFMVGFFVLFLCVQFIHRKQASDIVTGRKRVDWWRILFGAGIWGSLSILLFSGQMIFGETSTVVFQFDPVNFSILLVISLLLFPFQTSFEELVFRGYLMQWSAYLLKYRWAAIVLTGTLFGLMHAANPEVENFGFWIAMPQYILMGLLLGYVAVKDNGMELSLGIHMANNILAALTFTSDSSTLQTAALFRDTDPSASWVDIAGIVVCGLVFIWISDRKLHYLGKVDIWKRISPETEE